MLKYGIFFFIKNWYLSSTTFSRIVIPPYPPFIPSKVQRAMSSGAIDESPSFSESELIELMKKVDIKVGRMLSVEKHPNAEKLYIESVDLGERTARTVVSGLVPYFTPEQIKDRLCLFVTNLKPAAMRGTVSQAMVLVCHEKKKEAEASHSSKLEFLEPPPGSVPGDRIQLFDNELSSLIADNEILNPKKKIFESVQPYLSIRASDGVVIFYDKYALRVNGKGLVTVPTIRNGSVS